MPTDLSGLRQVHLADKFDLSKDDVYLTGTQALVRLCLMQAAIDKAAGLNTAGYVTGYRGSPLGGLDQQFSSARKVLEPAGVLFQPGLNEDLAATAVWGTQQAGMRGEGTKDGVFALWYGKGPGVDRTGDVFRHGNLAGSAELGGVLALLGDDHTCESSTTCHQSEYALVDAMMPILNPANIEEIVEFGLHGWAMSRYSGLWVGLKCVKDNVESSGSVHLPLDRPMPALPAADLPDGGLNIRAGDDRHEQERRLHRHKLDAAKAYARANTLDRVVWAGGNTPRIGVVSTGKSWMDTQTAFEILGADAEAAAESGVASYKVGMVWPLEPEGLIAFAEGLDLLIVVEEKRGLIESQVRQILYEIDRPPAIVGKQDEEGLPLFQADGALNPVQIAGALAKRVPAWSDQYRALIDQGAPKQQALSVARTPYFCAGCPHNSSTVLPDGARGYAGIGCHWMSQSMDRATEGYTHMGGEGANWIGEAPFSTRSHVFQNLGDGTYNHSGLMAIRAAVASGVNITYKILYNDAVAMTGGQSHEGGLPPSQIAREVLAAGVTRLEVVSDQPEAFDLTGFPEQTKVHHRGNLQAVQSQLAQVQGVTVLLYEQTCATEKRRRRKRGLMPDPPRRIMINPDVCEGCGDCGIQSNCVAILPLETPLGTKRVIDQSSCNKDFSCIKGFCPSFVTVEGGTLRKAAQVSAAPENLPLPEPVLTLDQPRSILLTGVGGTGVVTIGALIGMAAHLEGKGVGLIDMAGLAQKGGAVTTHVRLAARPDQIKAIRIAPASADVMLGCDLLTSASSGVLGLLKTDAHIVVNTHEMMTGAFVKDRNFHFPGQDIQDRLGAVVPGTQSHLVNATRYAEDLLGDTIGANLFMLGAAWQLGLVPLGEEALKSAIRLNGVAIDLNLAAFAWGRAWAIDPSKLSSSEPQRLQPKTSLSDIRADRLERLETYQNKAYARSYAAFVDKVAAYDPDPSQALAKAVARNLFKLMAYKDEYEVARMLSGTGFHEQIRKQFEGDIRIIHHLAPPMLPGVDPATGRPKKRQFGPWIQPMMRVLARFKRLRGTWADPFGYTEERRMERALITRYLGMIEEVLDEVSPQTYDLAVGIAETPDDIRGYGPVKHKACKDVADRQRQLMAQLRDGAVNNGKAA